MVRVVRRLKLEEYEVDCPISGDEKHHLHDGVVRGDKVRDKVQVPGGEDQGKETLTSTRYT